MSNYGPQLDFPFGGLGCTNGGQKWYQSKCRPHIPTRLQYTLYAYLAPFGHNTHRGRPADRQVDRNRPPMPPQRLPKNQCKQEQRRFIWPSETPRRSFLKSNAAFRLVPSTNCWASCLADVWPRFNTLCDVMFVVSV